MKQPAIVAVCAGLLLTSCAEKPPARPADRAPAAQKANAASCARPESDEDLAAPAATPQAAASPIELDPPATSEELQDGGSFAEDLGVSVEEAITYLRRQVHVGRFGARLSKKGPEAFVDLEIDYNPYRIVIYSTEPPSRAYRKFASKNGFEDLVPFLEVRQVRFSMKELNKALYEVDALAGDIPFDLAINITTNQVELITDNQSDIQQLCELIASGRLRLPAEAYAVIEAGMATNLEG